MVQVPKLIDDLLLGDNAAVPNYTLPEQSELHQVRNVGPPPGLALARAPLQQIHPSGREFEFQNSKRSPKGGAKTARPRPVGQGADLVSLLVVDVVASLYDAAIAAPRVRLSLWYERPGLDAVLAASDIGDIPLVERQVPGALDKDIQLILVNDAARFPR